VSPNPDQGLKWASFIPTNPRPFLFVERVLVGKVVRERATSIGHMPPPNRPDVELLNGPESM
jgi:hypothetical protein